MRKPLAHRTAAILTGCYPGTCRPPLVGSHWRSPFSTDRLLAWRFLVDNQVIRFNDALLGEQVADLTISPGDFVVKRKDNTYAYQLASVVDDIDMEVTDVLRGGDLLDSAPRQIALFRAFDAKIPRFWHVPVMHAASGEKLSKRDGSDSLAEAKRFGATADAIIGKLAASVGLAEPSTELSATALLNRLSLKRFTHYLKGL